MQNEVINQEVLGLLEEVRQAHPNVGNANDTAEHKESLLQRLEAALLAAQTLYGAEHDGVVELRRLINMARSIK